MTQVRSAAVDAANRRRRDAGSAARGLAGRLKRARRAELERQAVEKLADESLASIDTWLTVRDDDVAPALARLQAADRIVERILRFAASVERAGERHLRCGVRWAAASA